MPMRVRLGLVVATLVVATACARVEEPTPTPPERSVSATWELQGDDLLLHLEVNGFTVRFVPGDTSGRTGHLHLFVDRAPVAAGGQIGFEEGIVHTTNLELRVPGLAPGDHVVWVVAANGQDIAFDPPVATRIEVNVE